MSEPTPNSPLTGPPSGHCPPPETWNELAAGTLAPAASERHLAHAALCSLCAPLLLHAANLFDPQETPEEQALLAQLPTSTPAGQQALAQRLSAQKLSAQTPSAPSIAASPQWVGPQTKTSRHRLLHWPTWTLAAAACALITTGILYLRPPSDTTLLARAYDRHRTSDLRIPGETPGPLFSPTRAATGNTNSTPELLKLKLRTAEQLEKSPNDPALRQTEGRIAILDHDGDSARRDFELAEALNPALPRLHFDLATAEFTLAESGQLLSYARAIDLFSQHLRDTPNDPVALYDRALCWERTGVASQAIADFEAALAHEHDPRWRDEIQQHLTRLRAPQPQPTAPLTPQSFLSNPTDDSPGRYEQALEAATRTWLPSATDVSSPARGGAPASSPDQSQALTALATLGRRHNDLWLTDFLAAPTSAAANQALADALTASNRGSPDAALAAAAEATRLYAAARNTPGQLRAAAEHLYALQRMGREQDSLKEFAALQQHPALARYSSLNVLLQLDSVVSHGMLGEARDNPGTQLALLAAQQAHLPLAAARAASYLTGQQVTQSHFEAALGSVAHGLNDTAQLPGAAMFRYQLLSWLADTAKALQLPYTQLGASQAALAEVLHTHNSAIQAYAQENLGVLQLQLGETPAATSSFRAADTTLATLGDTPAIATYRADWRTDRAILQARTEGPARAAETLAAQAPIFNSRDVFEVQLRYLTERATLLAQAARPAEAIATLWPGLLASEQRLGTLHTPEERLSWQAESRPAWEVLTDTLARSGDAPAALRAWEFFRSTPNRTPSALPAAYTPNAFPPLPPQPAGHATLIYARILDHYLAWSLGNTGEVHMAAVDPSTRTANAFLRLCSDRNSSVADIHLLGDKLGNSLLGPFAHDLQNQQSIQLDLDPTLADIPFAAIPWDTTYFGLHFQLLTLGDAWSLPHATKNPDLLPTSPQLLAIRELPTQHAAPIPGTYDETSELANRFPQAKVLNAGLWREGPNLALSASDNLPAALSTAVIFHYTGHGLDELSAANNQQGSVILSREKLPQCRLAVLAACRSMRQAEGNQRDLPSFARILLAAGATRVLATQWDVDSATTRTFILNFYDTLTQTHSIAQSFHQAQQSLQSTPTLTHPYYWSAFQLNGNN